MFADALSLSLSPPRLMHLLKGLLGRVQQDDSLGQGAAAACPGTRLAAAESMRLSRHSLQNMWQHCVTIVPPSFGSHRQIEHGAIEAVSPFISLCTCGVIRAT